MKRTHTYLVFMSVLLFSFACKKAFEHEAITDSPSLLVVEGIINPGGQTRISLTRSLTISEKTAAKAEKGAKLQIEGSTNTIFPLTESSAGVYTLQSVNLSINQQYRLRIKTVAGKEYLSELMSIRTTPAIDSLVWKKDAGGVGIYVNAHDTNNKTTYYQWDYEETWEQHSFDFSAFIYKDAKIQDRSTSEIPLLYTCWRSIASTNILLTSTVKLGADVVNNFPLVHNANGVEKLGVRYSILVRQYAIGREAYEYLSLMKRNSEQQGSLFDNQPSEIIGNIKCITDPKEKVIGFLTISQVIEKRIFIKNDQLPGWNFNRSCSVLTVRNNKDSLARAFTGGINLVTSSNLGASGLIESYSGGSADCIDCRTRGGSNVKPAFW